MVIIHYAAYFGVGESSVDAEVLKCAWRDVKEFADFIGFEPLFCLLGFGLNDFF
jgi:hypothetical protein